MSERVCSLVILGWEIAVARGADPDLEGMPLIVSSGGRVWAASPDVATSGVRPGMALREAQTLSPFAAVVERDEKVSLSEFEPIAEAVEEITPVIEITAPGEITFRAKGAARAYGSEHELLERLFSIAPVVGPLSLPGCGGVRVGAAVAPGRFTAAMAARMAAAGREAGCVDQSLSKEPVDPTRGPPAASIVVDDGDESAFLAPFPVGVLGAEVGAPDLPETLMLLGVETLGDLAALPARSVASRFGDAGRLAHALSLGCDDRPLLLRSPHSPLEVTCALDPPALTLDQLTFAAKSLADQLGAEMEAMVVSAASIRVEAEDERGNLLTASWRNESGIGSAAERARWHLEAWRPEGAITSMRLIPEGIEAERGRQLRLTGVGGAIDPALEARAERAVSRLQAVLGPEGALEVGAAGGRLPSERAVTGAVERLPLDDQSRGRRRARRMPPWPGTLPSPAPARTEGVSAAVGMSGSTPFDPPEELKGRPISAAAGPFRYRLRWWSPSEMLEADLWQVMLEDGTAFLLSHRHDGDWLLEAVYD